MGLNIGLSYQSFQLGLEIQGLMYQAAHTWSLDSELAARFIGVGTASARASTAIIASTTAIFELAIKGVVNLFGSACSNRCDFAVGAVQLLFLTPLSAFALIFTIAEAALRWLVEIICVAITPSTTLQGARDQAANDIRKLSRHDVWGDQGLHGLALFLWNPLPPPAPRHR